MDIDTLEGLMKCPLMKGLTQQEVMNLMHQIRYRVMKYEKGDIFAHAGDKCLHADIVLDGELLASVVSPSGRIVQMNLRHAGNMVAPAFIFANDNHYPVTVKTLKDTTILRLLPDAMELLFRLDSRISSNMVSILSNIVAFQAKKIGILSMNLREKIIHLLHEEQQKQSTNRLLMPSRQELANMLGVQKYSVQRTLNELQADGTILLDGRHIEILNPEGLKM